MLAAEPHEDFEVLVTVLILRRRNGAVSLRASFCMGCVSISCGSSGSWKSGFLAVPFPIIT